MNPGELTTLVTFDRGTPVTDDYGGETLEWAQLGAAMAKVTYGTGEERRRAAQEQAEQAATVMVRWTPTLADVDAKDRAIFNGTVWDITSIAPVGLNKELHFTVTRSE